MPPAAGRGGSSPADLGRDPSGVGQPGGPGRFSDIFLENEDRDRSGWDHEFDPKWGDDPYPGNTSADGPVTPIEGSGWRADRQLSWRSALPVFAMAALALGGFLVLTSRPGSTGEVQAVTDALDSSILEQNEGVDSVTAGADTTSASPATETGADPTAGTVNGDAVGGDGDDPGTGAEEAEDGSAGTTPDDPTSTEASTANEPAAAAAEPEGPVLYYNDFSAGVLGPEWEQYTGPGNEGWGLRRPSALSIISDPGATAGGRCLAITARMGTGADAGQMVSGGLKLLGYGQTYGRYTIRMRVEDDPDQVTSGVTLLWPTSNRWPQEGEINIVENFYNRATRFPVESRLHWMKPGSAPPYDRADDALNQVDHAIDGTDWHTYTLEWRADAVTISIDGGAPVSMSTGNALIPRWDMDLTLQLDGHDAPGTGRQPVLNGEVAMCVDFVRVERI